MDFSLTAEDEAFRQELRDWLDVNLTEFRAEGETAVAGETPEARKIRRGRDWQRRLLAGGWAAINWPKAWGGREATIMQNFVYAQEMARVQAPGVFNPNGIWQIGPMIIRWGSDEQKQRWLPQIVSGETHWCQGFSEPEAGSDLANLRTTAVRDGDDYVLNGQKIWTSTAHYADWGLFLVRTDPKAIEEGRKHEGITALIVDMHVPGVDVQPIIELTREHLFNSVFFSDARIPAAYRLGEEGDGWKVAMGTLGHERIGTSSISISMRFELDRLLEATRKQNPAALDDPSIRDRVARMHTQLELTRLLNARALSKVLKGEKNWPEVPLAKLQWSSLSQTLAELAVDMLGPAGLMAKGGPDAVDDGTWSRNYVWQRYTSIGAGATEVQKNIIADKAIQLPRR